MKLTADAGLDFNNLYNPVQAWKGVTNFSLKQTDLGGLVSSFLAIAIMLSGLLMFIWLGWGIFQYLFAGGNKENLKKAQSRITWAIVGFIFIILAYSISGFIVAIAKSKP